MKVEEGNRKDKHPNLQELKNTDTLISRVSHKKGFEGKF